MSANLRQPPRTVAHHHLHAPLLTSAHLCSPPPVFALVRPPPRCPAVPREALRTSVNPCELPRTPASATIRPTSVTRRTLANLHEPPHASANVREPSASAKPSAKRSAERSAKPSIDASKNLREPPPPSALHEPLRASHKRAQWQSLHQRQQYPAKRVPSWATYVQRGLQHLTQRCARTTREPGARRLLVGANGIVASGVLPAHLGRVMP